MRLCEWRQRCRAHRSELHATTSYWKMWKKVLPLLSVTALSRIAFACDPAASKQMYLLDHEHARHPHAEDNIPWSIVWLLTTLNKKHCLHNGISLPPSHFAQASEILARKIKWAWAFRDDISEPNGVAKLRPKSHITCAYRGEQIPPNSIQAVCNEFSNFMGDRYRAMVNIRKKRNPEHIVFKIALRALERGGWAPTLTDKDGGWCLTSCRKVCEVQNMFLNSCDYEPASLQLSESRLGREYFHMCKHVAKFEMYPRLTSILMESWSDPKAVHFSSLQLTCKTHKFPVKFRNIHAASNNKYFGLAKWLSIVLDKYLAKHTHILKDTLQLVEQIDGQNIGIDDRFICIDLAHFFMTGQALDLAESSSRVVDDNAELQTLCRDVAFFLLSNQFVRPSMHRFCKAKEVPTFRVTRGSGMGLTCSSSIAEASFLHKCESKCLGNMQQQGIQKYYRFKDDVLLITSGNLESVGEFFRYMKYCSRPFELECVQVSRTSVKYLEVQISKTDDGVIQCVPFNKVTKLSVPFLAMDSDHHPRVLRNWPHCFIRRRCRLSKNPDIKHRVISEAVSVFSRQGFPGPILNKLRNLHCLLEMESGSAYEPQARGISLTCVREKTLWVVLPYVPSMISSRFE